MLLSAGYDIPANSMLLKCQHNVDGCLIRASIFKERKREKLDVQLFEPLWI